MEKEKKAKKSILLAVIMALLIGVIAFGSFTFAKYVTSETTGSKSARVAKWGFTISLEADDLFGDAYSRYTKVSHDANSVDVKADTAGEDLVAPGTSGSMKFSIGGTAQVLSKLTIERMGQIKDIVLTHGTGDGASAYYPVKWTLKKDGEALITDGRLRDIVSEIESYSEDAIEINKPLAHAGTYTIEWRWEFSGDDETNQKDTILGQIANGTEVENYTATTDVMFNLKITIEQIQAPAKTPTD